MMHSVFHWLRRSSARQRAASTRRRSKPRRSSVPQLLVLEDRTVLSVLTVLNNADSGAGSLRDTIAAAQSGDTIVFDPSLAYETITLSSGPLALGSNLTIDGLGANLLAISGNDASQLFTLSGTRPGHPRQPDPDRWDVQPRGGGLHRRDCGADLGQRYPVRQSGRRRQQWQRAGRRRLQQRRGQPHHRQYVVREQPDQRHEGKLRRCHCQRRHLVDQWGHLYQQCRPGQHDQRLTRQPGGSQGGAIGNLDGATVTITLSTFTGNQALGTRHRRCPGRRDLQ